MGRRKLETRLYLLSEQTREAMRGLGLGRPGAFWSTYLATHMGYQAFKTAYDGRPSILEIVLAIESAVRFAVYATLTSVGPDVISWWEFFKVDDKSNELILRTPEERAEWLAAHPTPDDLGAVRAPVKIEGVVGY